MELIGCALMLSSAVLSSSVFSSSVEEDDSVDGIALLPSNNDVNECGYQTNSTIMNNTKQNGRESRTDGFVERSFSNVFQKVNSSLKGSPSLMDSEGSSFPITSVLTNFGSMNSEL